MFGEVQDSFTVDHLSWMSSNEADWSDFSEVPPFRFHGLPWELQVLKTSENQATHIFPKCLSFVSHPS